MRYIFVSIVLTLVCACGGGGGGSAGPSPLEQVAQQILETCGATTIDSYLELLAIFEGLLDPAETDPQTFMILVTIPADAGVDWELDLDADPGPDVLGRLQFVDAAGDPETTVDVDQLQTGFDDLDLLLPTVPDGTSMVFAMLRGAPPPFEGSFTFDVTGSAVSQVAGDFLIQDLLCEANLSFSGASLANVGGAVPTLVITITLTAPEGDLAGTVTLDGTNIAVVEVSVDGSAQTFSFEINLTTGAVTAAP